VYLGSREAGGRVNDERQRPGQVEPRGGRADPDEAVPLDQLTAFLAARALTAAALAPDLALFLFLLAAMGLTNLAFQSMANASVQVAADPTLRGRIMGLYMLAFIGGTPIGAPLIGALTSHFGARAGMAVCGVVPALAAALVAIARRRRAEPPTTRTPTAATGTA
jgi:MFS family permease